MSETTASRSPVRCDAPTRLAAGPERIVSTGFNRATSAPTSAPSPRTTIVGARTPNAPNERSAASSRRWTIGTSRAFSTQVIARRGASSRLESSCPHVTGRPVRSRRRSRTAISCSGLRTENMDATANAPTEPSRSASARSRAERSRAPQGRPAASWPPAIRTHGSPRSASAMPALAAEASSKPTSTSATRPPCPSTSALVARVVESETSATEAGSTPEPSSTDSAAPRIPTARSWRVVSAFAAAVTRSACSSYSTASV